MTLTPATAEITGLVSAMNHVAALTKTYEQHATTGDTFVATLAGREVSGQAVAAAQRAREAERLAAGHWAACHQALTQQLTVKDAYTATPGAGSKQFLIADTGTGSPATHRPGSDDVSHQQPDTRPHITATDPATPPGHAGGEDSPTGPPGGAMTAEEKAVLEAWAQLRMIDDSPEALRIRAEADAIRRRHRPAPEANPYTGTIKVDDLGLDPEETLTEAAQHLRWTADMFDDNIRTGQGTQDADAALFWHAAADAVDAAAAAEPPASRAPWPGMDEASLQRWRHDQMIQAQAQELYGDEDTEEAAQLQREAAAIERRRRLAHRAAIKAGVTPCIANRSRSTPCVHPDGDHHEGLCFSADGDAWPRHTSWWAPETWDNQHETTRRPVVDASQTEASV